MFMFRKKDKLKSETSNLEKEAKKFQNAVKDINTRVAPNQIDINILESYAEKTGIDISFFKETFDTYLKNNALNAVRKIKDSSDYTVLDLEQAVESYGFELDDLNITFFSEE